MQNPIFLLLRFNRKFTRRIQCRYVEGANTIAPGVDCLQQADICHFDNGLQSNVNKKNNESYGKIGLSLSWRLFHCMSESYLHAKQRTVPTFIGFPAAPCELKNIKESLNDVCRRMSNKHSVLIVSSFNLLTRLRRHCAICFERLERTQRNACHNTIDPDFHASWRILSMKYIFINFNSMCQRLSGLFLSTTVLYDHPRHKVNTWQTAATSAWYNFCKVSVRQILYLQVVAWCLHVTCMGWMTYLDHASKLLNTASG